MVQSLRILSAADVIAIAPVGFVPPHAEPGVDILPPPPTIPDGYVLTSHRSVPGKMDWQSGGAAGVEVDSFDTIDGVPLTVPFNNSVGTFTQLFLHGFTIDGGGSLVVPADGLYDCYMTIGVFPDTAQLLQVSTTIIAASGGPGFVGAVGYVFPTAGRTIDNQLCCSSILQAKAGDTLALSVTVYGKNYTVDYAIIEFAYRGPLPA